MNKIVWVHEQSAFGAGQYLYVIYDDFNDNTTIIEGVRGLDSHELYYHPYDLDTFKAKFYLSGRLVTNWEWLNFHQGVELHKCDKVTTYITNANGESYIVLKIDMEIDELNVYDYSSFFGSFMSSPEIKTRYIVINCNIETLYLLCNSNNFKKAILEKLKYEGFYACRKCTISALEGFKYA